MTLTRTTVVDAAAYALTLAGKSRDHLPVPWTDSAAIDDCARFCSHVLWGGKPGPISWVDNFKSAGDGSYAAGSGDLQSFDVLLFDWEHNGVGNHVEFMVADLGGGYVRTFGANGSDTRAAAYRRRPKSYILGRFRPAWSAAAGAQIVHPQSTATPIPKEYRDMFALVPVPGNNGFHVVSLTNGKRTKVESTYHLTLLDRLKKNDGKDEMLFAELDICRAYLRKVA